MWLTACSAPGAAGAPLDTHAQPRGRTASGAARATRGAALQRLPPPPPPPPRATPLPRRGRQQLAAPPRAASDVGAEAFALFRGRQQVAPPRRAAAGADAETDAEAGYETDNDGQTVEQRLSLVRNMVTTAELLVPYDRSAVNLGLILWGAIRNIPRKDRVQLVDRLNSADITRLWKVAGQRYTAPKQQVAAAIGPDYSLWKDLPASAHEVSRFRGKAALPTHVLGISSFDKAFFLQPESEQLYGRVLLGKGPLGDLLYPLYFKATVGPCVVPTTQELCDLKLEYLPPQQLGLSRRDLPRAMWPSPRPHLPPFHEGFTDYLRAVAPGVYVGLGYRTASTEPNDPLYFMMVHQRAESLL